MTERLVNLLKSVIEMELSSSTRYLWQYVTLEKGMDPGLRATFKDSSIEKLKRGMLLGERMFSLEGMPTTQPIKVNIGNSLKEMIDLDLRAEIDVISKYKEIVKAAKEEGDGDTQSLCEKILAEEEQLKNILMCERGRLHTKLVK